MDPKDLLITNQFISPTNTTSFTQHRNRHETTSKEFMELKQYLKSYSAYEDPLRDEQKDFLSDEEDNYDFLETKPQLSSLASTLNRSQWIHRETPMALREGVLPILSKSLQDTTKVRYRKQIVSYINVDSRRRDNQIYPNPGHYRIFLNKEFRNLYSIRLEQIIFREPPTPINSNNNCFIWSTNYTGLNSVPDGTIVEYQTIIPGAFYTLSEFVQVVEETLNSIPHTLPGSLSVSGLFPMFRLTIDPFSRIIRFIQRLEEFIVTGLDTTVNSNVIRITISNQSGIAPPGPPDYPFLPTVDDVPIIFTGLEMFAIQFGGIPVSFLDQVPFFPVPQNPGINTYDIISGNASEYVYELTVFNKQGDPTIANQSRTYDLTTTNLPNFPSGHAIEVTVGRALLFNIPIECNPFGTYLGLQNQENYTLIHTNVDEKKAQVINTIPWMIIGEGQLALDTTDYILMRIETKAKPIGTISGNLTCAIGSVNHALIQNNKKNDAFFAKIVFAGTSPGDVVINAVGGDKLFYDAPLVQLVDLDIQFFDSSGNVLELTQNHSFVLQIVELREVLRDTLIDSRTGNIADIGAGISTTNPLD